MPRIMQLSKLLQATQQWPDRARHRGLVAAAPPQLFDRGIQKDSWHARSLQQSGITGLYEGAATQRHDSGYSTTQLS